MTIDSVGTRRQDESRTTGSVRTGEDGWMEIRDPAALRRARIQMRYSQRDLGHLVRRTQTTIYKIETGQLRNISEDLALALAGRLNCSWEELFIADEVDPVVGADAMEV